MLSRILVLIKTSEDNSTPVNHDEILQLIIALVEKYDLKEAFRQVNLRQMEGHDLLLFVLLYHYTQNEQYQIITDYDDWLTNYPKERKAFMDKLLAIFTQNEQLDTVGLEKLFPFLGKNLENRLLELLTFHEELLGGFKKYEFIKTLL